MIWCVEDEGSIRDIEVYALNSSGLKARGFEDGGDFWSELKDTAKDERPGLIILDVMLPGLDGVELLKKIKGDASLKNIPIIMATAKGTEYDKIESLDLGADYYLVKPFGVMELVSTVRAVLRRYSSDSSKTKLSYRGIDMNLKERTVKIDGTYINLTYKEFEMLCMFLSQPGVVISREQFFNEVWGTDYVGETRTVDVHIRTLRGKLGKYGDLIETVRNVGYRFKGND